MSTVKRASPERLLGDPLAVSFSLYPVIRASPCLAIMLLSLADISLFMVSRLVVVFHLGRME